MKIKKSILAFMLVLMLIPATCFAGKFTVNSDNREFNIVTGEYNLAGHVVVEFPAQGSTMTITGDKAIVQMYQQELHGNGNITLAWDNLNFNCDKVDVYHTQSTAYLKGNLKFKANGNNISSDTGSYNWNTKVANFSGNVIVNGCRKSGDVNYSFKTNSFI